jgi:hypothetical protein
MIHPTIRRMIQPMTHLTMTHLTMRTMMMTRSMACVSLTAMKIELLAIGRMIAMLEGTYCHSVEGRPSLALWKIYDPFLRSLPCD